MKHPLFTVTLVYILGILTGRHVVLPAGAVFVLIGLLLAAQLLLLRRYTLKRDKLPSGRLLFIALLLLGMLSQYRLDARARRADAILEQAAAFGEVKISGRLAGDPLLREDYCLLTMNGAEILAGDRLLCFPAKIQVNCKSQTARELLQEPPAWGDRLIVWGRLESARGQSNPDQFDYELYLESRGIHGVVWLSDQLSLQQQRAGGPRGAVGGLHRALIRFRLHGRELLKRHFSDRQQQVLGAVCFGGGSRLDPRLRQAYANCGLMHIFAVSGLHTTIVAWLIFTLGRLLQFNRRAAAILTVGGLLVYMTLAAFSPPVVRAVIMTCALLYSFFISTRVDGVSTLSLALFINVLLSPAGLGHPGFQLSYLAVFGILLFYPVAASWLLLKLPERAEAEQRKRAAWKRWINACVLQVLCVSIGAQILLAPLLAQYFHRVPLLGLLLNVLALPLVMVLIALAFAIFISGLVAPLLVAPLTVLAAFCCELLNGMIETAARLPLVSLPQLPWPWWAAAGYYALWLLLPTIRERRTPLDAPRQRAMFLLQVCGLLLMLTILPALSRPAGKNFRATFLDVGQGDCTLIEIPGGRTILIDAGTEHHGWRTVLSLLESRGIRRIDLAVITHDDADHYGDFDALAGAVAIAQLILPADPTLSDELRHLLARLRSARVDVRPVTAPAEIKGFRNTALVLLSPGEFLLDTPGINDNDLSAVLLIAYGDFEMLLTGDCGFAAERLLAADARIEGLDVLKAGHHGSKNSSGAELLRRVRPALAVISCGSGNRHGHPAPEALLRLQQAGAQVYRTDRDGAIILETDGTRLRVSTLINRREVDE